jgi:hypothetical protein
MNNLENLFVNYEQALKLKSIGFDEPCFTYYEIDGRLSDTPKESGDDIKYQGDCKFDNHQNTYLDEDESCSAPTNSQVFRWFRNYSELYKIQSIVQEYDINNWMFSIDDGISSDISVVGFESYEEAESACIDKLIEIVKNLNDNL